ncbi:hypothetical protein LOB66_03110 [Lactobacillus delbrueckii subsp. lactis]|uniref:hypothetical protein n=1 Tax=Lactobacillus delbrueckii TaxID=1584 RepID=UPI001E447B28|nr:hypothetical protein [Lactobacillus delbrueckii]MCD5493579.1 hypothetical protein [Lactobacillus delbrueckii subsp. lactis]
MAELPDDTSLLPSFHHQDSLQQALLYCRCSLIWVKFGSPRRNAVKTSIAEGTERDLVVKKAGHFVAYDLYFGKLIAADIAQN